MTKPPPKIVSLLLSCALAVAIQPFLASNAWAGGYDKPPKDNRPAYEIPPALTAAEQKQMDVKDTAVRKAAQDRLAKSATQVSAQALYYGSTVHVVHQTEQTSVWCGPATLAITVSAFSGQISQDTAAAALHVAPGEGTPWYSTLKGGYPMKNALNAYTAGSYPYAAVSLAYSPSASDKTSFQARLPYAVDRSYAVAGNALIVAGGPRFSGWPAGAFGHWVSINGYYAYGAGSYFDDPASGLGGIFANVPANGSIDSNTMVVILGGRGYVW